MLQYMYRFISYHGQNILYVDLYVSWNIMQYGNADRQGTLKSFSKILN